MGKFASKVFWFFTIWLWRKSCVVFAYYWERRRAFWRHFTEYARDLRAERFINREIRISSEEQYLNAEYDEGEWKVRLPKLCITCGEPVKGKSECRQYEIESLTGPFWSVVLGTFFGFALSLVYWSWLLPIGIVVGFAVGYGRHTLLEAEIRFWQCAKHKESPRYPQLRAFADFLIIGVGSKTVRQEFRHQRQADHRDPGIVSDDENLHESSEYMPPREDTLKRPDLDPIPLADEVHETIEPDEQTDRLVPREGSETEQPPL